MRVSRPFNDYWTNASLALVLLTFNGNTPYISTAYTYT